MQKRKKKTIKGINRQCHLMCLSLVITKDTRAKYFVKRTCKLQCCTDPVICIWQKSRLCLQGFVIKEREWIWFSVFSLFSSLNWVLLVAASSWEELLAGPNLPDLFHLTWHTESLAFLLWLLSKIYQLTQEVFASLGRRNAWVLSPQFLEDYHRKHSSFQCKVLKMKFELFSVPKAGWGPSCTLWKQARSGNKPHLQN